MNHSKTLIVDAYNCSRILLADVVGAGEDGHNFSTKMKLVAVRDDFVTSDNVSQSVHPQKLVDGFFRVQEALATFVVGVEASLTVGGQLTIGSRTRSYVTDCEAHLVSLQDSIFVADRIRPQDLVRSRTVVNVRQGIRNVFDALHVDS